jgi:hypothetical protein
MLLINKQHEMIPKLIFPEGNEKNFWNNGAHQGLLTPPGWRLKGSRS